MEDQLFEKFYEQTSRPLWAYAARLSGDPSAADDILQDAYIRFLNAPKRPDDLKEAKQYLFKIATNLVYDRSRKIGRRSETEFAEAAHSGSSAFAGDIEMSQVFSRLKEQDKILLWLAYVEGHDHNEIAQIAGFRKLSVKVLLYRARRRLSELIRGNENEANGL